MDIIKSIQGYNDIARKNIVDLFEKGKRAEEGEIREWNGRKMKKTSAGWVAVKKGEKSVKEENSEEKTHSKKELQGHAKNASEADLQRTIKESPDEKLRIHAHQELARREKEEHIQDDKEKPSSKNKSQEKLYVALDSGKFKKQDRITQNKLINDCLAETSQIEKNLTQNFSEDEIDALDNYVSISYKDINGYLRKENVDKDEKLDKTIKLIDSAIKKNTLKEDLVIYRSLSGSGELKQDNAFQSASIDPYASYQFMRDGGKIHKLIIPKGTNYAYIGGGEKEILLPRGLDLSKYKE
jgi:hypothetical protein